MIMHKIKRTLRYLKHLLTVSDRVDQQTILAAKALNLQIAERGQLKHINDAEFKVFSQFGEDGILQYLIRQAGIPAEKQTFVEFGVETYEESNTRFLLMNDFWRGMVMDGSQANIDVIKRSPVYWRQDLTATTAFIDKNNINQLIADGGFSGEIGLLSVDIDGNDYWVWEAIDVVNPIIVVAEYNSVFGSDHAVTVPYDPDFVRAKAHYSYLYWGCSITALDHLARKKGYQLVGGNLAGNNVFFVRNDHMQQLEPVTVEEAYRQSSFRESRDKDGALTFLPFAERRKLIENMPLIQVDTHEQVTLRSLEQTQ